MQKHGKSSNHLFNIKKSFFQNNDELLKQSIEYSKKYKEQPVRLTCKNCNEKLSEIQVTGEEFFFSSDQYQELYKLAQIGVNQIISKQKNALE